ncbi:hypothetical protein BDV95DRAFT_639039 [Massariosphaeria phaeospora]|uniref:CCHC-type domain-containing protein n=1 Tax=Massariosphaeria phaeospora TaxID=100035 RepID=A0A7C8M7Q1_9PLEO|nr:hypothetical protein BDV95DRAFT_639039 [Massariosphaeria phaeospora]
MSNSRVSFGSSDFSCGLTLFSTSLPSPPLSPLRQLETFLGNQAESSVWNYCLGIQDLANAPALIDDTIVVAYDTEMWTGDSSRMLEIGLSTFSIRDMRSLINRGVYGKELMKVFRVGFFGHALQNDLRNLRDTLGFDVYGLGTVVKTVDTQHLARDYGVWPQYNNNSIGHERLVGMVGFAYRDAHTACNDIGMSINAGILMALRKPEDDGDVNSSATVQEVIDDVEKESQKYSHSHHGVEAFCLRCGQPGHFREDCNPRKVKVRCAHCVEAGRDRASYSHVSEFCISHAVQQSKERQQQARADKMEDWDSMY